MISPPESSGTVGNEGGDLACGGIVALDSFVCQAPRWCANCGGQQTFVEVYEVEAGRLGFCFGCGDEKFAPFTRTVGEAA